MTGFLAAVAVVVWLAGIAVHLAVAPRAIRNVPEARAEFDEHPIGFGLFLACCITVWPALHLATALTKLTERRKP